MALSINTALFTLLGILPLGWAQEPAPKACVEYRTGNERVIRHKDRVNSAVFSPDGDKVVIASDDRTAKIFDLISGQEKIIQHKDKVGSAAFSPDGSKVVTASDDGTAKILDLQSGEEKIIQHKFFVRSATFSADGSKVITASYDGTAKIINLQSDKVKIIQHEFPVDSAVFSHDESKVITVSGDGSAKIIDLQSGKVKIIQHKDTVRSATFSPDGGKVITASDDGTAKIIDFQSGKVKIIQHEFPVNSSVFSHDGSKVVTASNDGSAKIIDLKSEKEKIIQHLFRVNSATFSPDDSKVVTASNDSTAKIIDLQSGKVKIIQHKKRVNSATFSSDGSKVVTASDDGTAKILDLQSGMEKIIQHVYSVNSAAFSPDGSKVVTASKDDTVKILDPNSSCISDYLKLHQTACTTGPGGEAPEGALSPQNIQTLDQVQEAALCSAAIEDPVWKTATPDDPPQPLTLSALRTYLMRFSKAGGFTPEKHLPVFLASLRSSLVQSHPALIQAALIGIYSVSNLLYQDLLELHPVLLNLPSTPESNPTRCLSTKDRTNWTQAARVAMKNAKASNPSRTTLSNWNLLTPLAPALSLLPESEKEAAIDSIAQSLADHAADSKELHGVFLSKLYKFSYQSVAPWFGEKPKVLNDLTWVREGGTVKPILLSTAPIEGDSNTQTPYGFAIKSLPVVTIPADAKPNQVLFHDTIRWKSDGHSYRAPLQIQVQDKTLSVASDPAPNYSGLWKDQKLKGVVIAGSNMESLASGVMSEYLAYYQKNGFVFDEKEVVLKDLPEYLNQQVSNGSADYLIKEAHSDGDEKNLFRMDTTAKLKHGVKLLKDGRREEVDLIFPDKATPSTKHVSNHEFGEWIRAREQNSNTPIVYFNTSCWSKNKAVNEIEATNSPLLINIPSTTTVQTFGNHPTNAEYQLFTSFRQGETYEQMRTALRKNKEYEQGNENVFIFPDESAYDQHIRQVLKVPLKIDVTIQDEKGNVVRIDE